MTIITATHNVSVGTDMCCSYTITFIELVLLWYDVIILKEMELSSGASSIVLFDCYITWPFYFSLVTTTTWSISGYFANTTHNVTT